MTMYNSSKLRMWDGLGVSGTKDTLQKPSAAAQCSQYNRLKVAAARLDDIVDLHNVWMCEPAQSVASSLQRRTPKAVSSS